MIGIAILVVILIGVAIAFRLYQLQVIWRKAIGYKAAKTLKGDCIYFYRGAYENPAQVKIGRSDDVISRLRSARTANPNGLHIYGIVRVKNDVRAETFIHRKFADRRLSLRNEWFWLSFHLFIYIMLVRDFHLTSQVREKLK